VGIDVTIAEANLIEIDKLFIPGASGSPILNTESNKVIGYVHAFRSWPIPTGSEIKQTAEITENGNSKNIDLKYNVPLVASLSLGIDTRTIQVYLENGNFLPKIE